MRRTLLGMSAIALLVLGAGPALGGDGSDLCEHVANRLAGIVIERHPDASAAQKKELFAHTRATAWQWDPARCAELAELSDVALRALARTCPLGTVFCR